MAYVTDLGFTMLELGKAKDDGDVRSQVHPEFPELEIFNYTEDVQYRNRWNKITLACRGLILNTVTGEIVARPWEKFFNLGQMDNRIAATAPVEVTDKLDGSLGILYREPGITKFDGTYLPGDWAIATRGSFASEQAIHATGLLATKYRNFIDNLGHAFDITALFEIVYPDNRIVVNYGDMDDLVLLGGVHKERGYYLGPWEVAGVLDWTGPVTEVFEYPSFVAAISAPDRKGKEGYVIRSGRNIVKSKQADYVELHRIVTNLSPKTIWEMIGDGKTVADICAGIPDEFHKYVEDIGNGLIAKASEIEYAVNIYYGGLLAKLGGEPSRRAFAEKATKSQYAKYLFLLFDGKSIRDQIWKHIKPRGDVKSLVEDEG